MATSLLIRNSSELIAAVPYVLGFHPVDSVAVVGFNGRSLHFAGRYDLPPPDCDVDDFAAENARVVARQDLDFAMVVGYGPPERVTPAALSLADALTRTGLRVADVMRVTDGRWWSYGCDDPRCCPAEGTPCLPGDSVIAAEATYHGKVALPSRRDLVAQVAAVTGEPRERMATATERARKRFTDLLAADQRHGRSIRRAGRGAVRDAEKRYRAGRPLTDDEVAWLGVLLVDSAVQDYALDRTGTDEWRVRLWTDVLRRAEPAHVAAPACMLAFAAWRLGAGPLALVALERALKQEPGHELAGMLHDMIRHGIGPQMVERDGDRGRRPR
ncbi:DUF4192 domain-containing protein [Actinoplanes sp. NPDC051861]|uniref:DUF4192 domain-containing protein n=1 Tax=Actinoplanes sp. NPDC051861 TaxID=3155170 RepID=UPI00344685C9